MESIGATRLAIFLVSPMQSEEATSSHVAVRLHRGLFGHHLRRTVLQTPRDHRSCFRHFHRARPVCRAIYQNRRVRSVIAHRTEGHSESHSVNTAATLII